MKRFLLVITSLLLKISTIQSGFPHAAEANMITVASTEILHERFEEMLLEDFYLQSGSIQALAGREVHVLMVLSAVNIALASYKKRVNIKMASFMYSIKSDILSIILDSDEKLTELKNIMAKIESNRLQYYKKPLYVN